MPHPQRYQPAGALARVLSDKPAQVSDQLSGCILGCATGTVRLVQGKGARWASPLHPLTPSWPGVMTLLWFSSGQIAGKKKEEERGSLIY